MTDPIEGEVLDREPVVNAGRLAGLLSAAVIAILGVVAIVVGGNVLGDLTALGNAITTAIVALGALAAYLLPVWQAVKARAKVTPLVDPRDDDGTPLVADLGDGATGAPYSALDAPTAQLEQQDPQTNLIPGRIPYSGRAAQEDGVADHGEDGPRSEAARQARLNEPDV